MAIPGCASLYQAQPCPLWTPSREVREDLVAERDRDDLAFVDLDSPMAGRTNL